MLPAPQHTRALALLKERGMLRQRDLIAAGIAPEVLARLVRDELVVRPSRGLYQLPDQQVDANQVLAEAAVLVPKGVVCLISALQFHGLTQQMPSAVWMAIDIDAWRPRVTQPSIRFVRFRGAALSDNITRHRIGQIEVSITDPARTVVDCFRFRSKVGLDVALEGLREALRSRRCTADDLWRIAKDMRAWTVMQPYVEASVSDGT